MTDLSTIYLIKKEANGTKREISAAEGNFLVGVSGTVNFGHQSSSDDSLGSVILGGRKNCAIANYSIVVGGESNSATGDYSSIGGGLRNCVNANFSTIAGGGRNSILEGHVGGTIGGGVTHRLNSTLNSAERHSTIGGGIENSISGSCSSIGGGDRNSIFGNFNSIGGGCRNCTCSLSRGSIIGGGDRNTINGSYSTIGGGSCSNVIGLYSFIGGGCCNSVNGLYSFIGGGQKNCVLSNFGYIPGGRCSVIQSSHSGAAILGDGQNRAHNSSGPHTLTLDFISGTYIKNKIIFQGDDYIPSQSTSFGISGQIAYDTNYHYRHDGIKWKRTALAEW